MQIAETKRTNPLRGTQPSIDTVVSLTADDLDHLFMYLLQQQLHCRAAHLSGGRLELNLHIQGAITEGAIDMLKLAVLFTLPREPIARSRTAEAKHDGDD